MTTPIGAPDLAAMKDWLGIEDTEDDGLLQTSLDAAIAAQCAVCTYPVDNFGQAVYSADLYEAVLLRTQRYAARRSSAQGVVGVQGTDGDFAAIRLPSTDGDIVRLESPWMTMVVG